MGKCIWCRLEGDGGAGEELSVAVIFIQALRQWRLDWPSWSSFTAEPPLVLENEEMLKNEEGQVKRSEKLAWKDFYWWVLRQPDPTKRSDGHRSLHTKYVCLLFYSLKMHESIVIPPTVGGEEGEKFFLDWKPIANDRNRKLSSDIWQDRHWLQVINECQNQWVKA